MLMMRRTNLLAPLAGLFLVALASGCNSSPASLRVVHASIDGAALDATLRDAKGNSIATFPGLAYAQATRYRQVPRAASYTLELRAAGTPADSPALVTSSGFALNSGERVTAVIAGLAGAGDDTVALQVLVEPEQFGTPPSGKVLVSVVNALPGMLSVAFSAGAITTGALARFGAVTLALPPGPLSLAAASTSGVQPVATSFTTSLGDRPAFLIATGLTTVLPRKDVAFELLQVGIDETTTIVLQDPFVYALHASPDSQPLDLFNGSSELSSALAFGALSPPLQLPPGDNAIDLFAHSPTNVRPAGDPITSVALGGLQAGQVYLAVAAGFVTAGRTPALQGGVYQEGFTLVPAMPVLRVVQASPDLPTAGMGMAGSDPFVPLGDFQNLSFLDATVAAGTQVQGNLTLGVVPAGSSAPMARFAITSQPNTAAFAVAAGASNPQPFDQPLQLIVVGVNGLTWTATATAASP